MIGDTWKFARRQNWTHDLGTVSGVEVSSVWEEAARSDGGIFSGSSRLILRDAKAIGHSQNIAMSVVFGGSM